tara:strand:+ start:6106 stop:7404 length:1299 start_codon:yes stop_codon:yes gene_type:complete
MSLNINNEQYSTTTKVEVDNIIKSKTIKTKSFNLKYKDLSHLKTYTIDEVNTFEVDDAISLERFSNCYKLWIHIASPSSHIEYDSELDKNARKLISSIYLVANNIYMFPERMIEEKFSLTIKEKRPSLSLGVIFNNDGSIKYSEIVETLIKPTFSLSYEEADELIDYAPKEEEDLSLIYKLLEKRNHWRKKLGAKEILESYGKIIVKNNLPTIKIIDPTLSRILISEAMILYGNLMANFTKENSIPVPYRVQEESNIDYKNTMSSDKNILYNFEVKKSMGKTYYSSQPLSHNGLGLDSYLHATSPIRRYSDLLVHYQIKRFLNEKVLITKEQIESNISKINDLGRQNINRYREDQKIWLNKWFKNNTINEYKVILLSWVSKYKQICIIYIIEYNISTICYLKSKIEIEAGERINIKDITTNYKSMLNFQLIL